MRGGDSEEGAVKHLHSLFLNTSITFLIAAHFCLVFHFLSIPLSTHI